MRVSTSLFSLLFIISCGSSDNDDSNNINKNETDINEAIIGTWQSDCVGLEDAYFNITYKFEADTLTKQTRAFEDQACSVSKEIPEVEDNFDNDVGNIIIVHSGIEKGDIFTRFLVIYAVQSGHNNISSLSTIDRLIRPLDESSKYKISELEINNKPELGLFWEVDNINSSNEEASIEVTNQFIHLDGEYLYFGFHNSNSNLVQMVYETPFTKQYD